jgi:hypothetical protein
VSVVLPCMEIKPFGAAPVMPNPALKSDTSIL